MTGRREGQAQTHRPQPNARNANETSSGTHDVPQNVNSSRRQSVLISEVYNEVHHHHYFVLPVPVAVPVDLHHGYISGPRTLPPRDYMVLLPAEDQRGRALPQGQRLQQSATLAPARTDSPNYETHLPFGGRTTTTFPESRERSSQVLERDEEPRNERHVHPLDIKQELHRQLYELQARLASGSVPESQRRFVEEDRDDILARITAMDEGSRLD